MKSTLDEVNGMIFNTISTYAKYLHKALSHGVIFLATCNAILLLGDVKLANTCFYHSKLIYISNIPNSCHKFTSLKSRIALQVARKLHCVTGPLAHAFGMIPGIYSYFNYSCLFKSVNYKHAKDDRFLFI